jgi:hypothetical protein
MEAMKPLSPLATIFRRISATVLASCLLVFGASTSQASTAYGTLNNFDCVNDTGVEAHGFEIELEDVHSRDITYTYDYNHYGIPKIREEAFSDPVTGLPRSRVFIRYAGTRDSSGNWSAFTAIPSGPITPTDGHQFTNPSVNFGGEHFGAGYYGAPTAVNYNWLIDDGTGNLVHGPPVMVATPTFTYYPPVGGQPLPQVQAAVVPPPPPAPPVLQFGVATWVKDIKTKTHNPNKVKLRDLVDPDPANPAAVDWRNGEPDEVETEWRILQTEFANAGNPKGELKGVAEDLPDGDEVITRRYEFYKYIGPIDAESGEAMADAVGPDGIHGVGTVTYNDHIDPLTGEWVEVTVDLSTVEVVGEFFGAQMSGFDVAPVLGLIDHIPDGEINIDYAERTVVVPGADTPFHATTTGALPDGTTLDEFTGIFSGTPLAAGVFTFTVEAKDLFTDAVLASKEYTVTIPAGVPVTHTIVTTASPAAGGSAVGGGTFDNGTSVTVVATHNPGYAFVNWTEDGVQVSDSEVYPFTVNADRTLVANFILITYTVTPSAGANGSISPNTAQTVNHGSNITFNATPNGGFVVNQWSLDGALVQNGGASYTLNNVTANHAVSVSFAPITYTVTPGAGANGSIGPNTPQTVNSGSDVTFNATPNGGFMVNEWSLDGTVVQTGGAGYTLNAVAANHTVSVTFTAITYTVTPGSGPGGGISPNTAQTVNSGGNVAFTATPSSGFAVNQWSLDGGVVQTGGASYTLNNVTGNHTVAVTFVPITFTVTPGAGANGGISPNTAQTVNSGGNVTFNATPNGGYVVNQWSLDGSVVQTGGPSYTLNNVTANHTVAVTFKLGTVPNYTVTPSAGANGSISPNTAQTVSSGSNVTFNATPSSGYVVNQWSLDGNVVQTGGASYTLNNVTANHTVAVTFTAAVASNFAGNYSGLASPTLASTNPARHVGLASVSVASTGSFTAKLKLGGSPKPVPFSGAFGADGAAHFGIAGSPTLEIERTGLPPVFLALSLNIQAPVTHQITGSLTEKGAEVARLEINRHLYTPSRNPRPPLMNVPLSLRNQAADAGKYTALFQALTPEDQGLDAAAFPQGDGYALMDVLPTGAVMVIGRLGDGQRFSNVHYLSKDNVLPLYVVLYGGTGTLSGPVGFRDLPSSDADGAGLRWFKPANAADTAFRPGWPGGIKVDLLGSKYVAPTLVNVPTARLILSDGNLASPTLNHFAVNAAGVVTVLDPAVGAPTLSMKLYGQGLFSGSFTHTPSGKTAKFDGVVLQKAQTGGGYFFGGPPTGSPAGSTPQSGAVTIAAE